MTLQETQLLSSITPIRFVEAKDGRGDGLGGIDVDCVDRDAVLAGAKQRGCGVNDEQVLLGGLRVYLRG